MNRTYRGMIGVAAALAVLAAIGSEAPGLTAQTNGAAQVTGELWVEGGSTVRSWDCRAGELQVDVTPGAAGAFTLEALGDAVAGLAVRVPAAALDCDDRTMNAHMRDALNVERHRTIEFRMERYAVMNGAAGPQVELVGSLEINGTTRPVTLRAKVETEGDGLRVRGVHTLKMTDYGVRPPRLMLGALRVHDEVEVHFDLLMTRRGSGSTR